MSLSVEQVRQMREQIKANDAAKTAAQKKKTTTQTAKTTPGGTGSQERRHGPERGPGGADPQPDDGCPRQHQPPADDGQYPGLDRRHAAGAWHGERGRSGQAGAGGYGQQHGQPGGHGPAGGLRTGLELCWQRQRPETAGHCAGHLRQLRQGGAEGGKRPCQGPADRPL